jgi:hypothetical protein
MRKIKILLLISFLVVSTYSRSQSLPVGSVALEEYFRRGQLIENRDSLMSFTIRPLYSSSIFLLGSKLYGDTVKEAYNILRDYTFNKAKDSELTLNLLPVDFQLRFNTHSPYGWNDGAMIPAKGLQTLVSGGIYAEYSHFSVQLKPELVIARNAAFSGLPTDINNSLWWKLYYDYYNYADLPERFGNDAYSRIFWGQSSIRLNFDPLSFGISTENLWWGPGVKNSLLMSNTATGFKHLTFNTSKPIETRVGSFEGQLIAGRLEGSGFSPVEPDPIYYGTPLYLPKPGDWRYLSGVIATWQPKWVSGFYLGFTRSFQVYSKDLGNRLGDYLPIFSPFQKIKADDPVNKRDERGSVFFRWVWPKEKAEIYFELGRNRPSGNLRDFTVNPQDGRAYIFGMQKLLPFGRRQDQYVQIGLEATQLQETSPDAVRSGKSIYVNQYIRHGYTNRGEPLGAGIGPGGSSQSLDIYWVSGFKKLGFTMERYAHNNDFYYYAFEPSLDWRRHWVDVSFAVNGTWDYKNFIFNARVQAIHSYNYKWLLKQNPGDIYPVNGEDASNFQGQVGLSYRF